MPYRVAAGLLEHLLPVSAGTSPETLRGHTLKAGAQLRDAAAVKPSAAVSAITVTVDSTFIRGCHDGERNLGRRLPAGRAGADGLCIDPVLNWVFHCKPYVGMQQ
jgi:hypothetical protein